MSVVIWMVAVWAFTSKDCKVTAACNEIDEKTVRFWDVTSTVVGR